MANINVLKAIVNINPKQIVITGEYYKSNLVQCNMLNIKLDLVDQGV